MPIVTLTTDFGVRDFYAGALKGALLRRSPGLQMVDISHDIKPFDIVQGAYVVQHAWPEFPEGTIHIIGVNCVYDKPHRFLAARRHGHYFIAPDNGLLTLLFPDWPDPDVRVLEALPENEFPSKTAFAEAAAYLVQDRPWEESAVRPDRCCAVSASSRSLPAIRSAAPCCTSIISITR